MALVHSPNEPMRPPSPSLTNPDMILPYDPESRESTPTPTSGTGPYPGLNSSRESNDMQRSANPRPTGTLPRPSMPGEWQTESTIKVAAASNQNSVGVGSYSQSAQDYGKGTSNGANLRAKTTRAEGRVEDEEGVKDPFSPLAFLRAEEILANAKKRLTTMESNLTRARSLSLSRSVSATSVGGTEARPPTSPSFASRGNGWAISAVKLRQTNFTGSAASGGHSRVSSETALPNTKPALAGRRFDGDRSRSSSAIGSKELDQELLQEERGFGARRQRQLEPLREDELVHSSTEDQSRRESPSSGQSTLSRLQSRSPNQMTKARSNVQLRDLREQMQDLKSKVSSLKQRTREDSLHRRSMQMLKSPNPFTDADAWSNPDSTSENQSIPEDDEPNSAGDNHRERNGASREATVIDDTSRRGSPNPEATPQPATKREPPHEEVEYPIDHRHSTFEPGEFHFGSPESQQGHFFNDDEDNDGDNEDVSDSSDAKGYDAASEGGTDESPHTELSELDEEPRPVPLSHEDRPDAFDYETFVLNSTMGSYSRQGRHSSGSSSSNSTIGPVTSAMDNYPHSNFQDAHSTLSLNSSPPHHASSRRLDIRRSSADSVSTVATFATFATATSGDNTHAQSTSRTQSRANSRVAHQSSHLNPSSAVSRPHSTASFSRPRAPSTVFHTGGGGSRTLSPTFESTSIRARSQILSTLLANPLQRSPRATPDFMLAIKPDDEAAIRAVIEGLQRCCGRLVTGDGVGDVRRMLDRARSALEGEGV